MKRCHEESDIVKLFRELHPEACKAALSLTYNEWKFRCMFDHVALFNAIRLTPGIQIYKSKKYALKVYKSTFETNIATLYFVELDMYISGSKSCIKVLATNINWYKGQIYQLIRESDMRGIIFACVDADQAHSIISWTKLHFNTDEIRYAGNQIYVEQFSFIGSNDERLTNLFKYIHDSGTYAAAESIYRLNTVNLEENIPYFRCQCNDYDGGLHLRR